MKYSVIYGSTRSARQGIKAVKFISAKLKARGHEIEVLDPMDLQLPSLDKMYKEYEAGQAPAKLESISKTLKSSDGFVIVSGEYNHSVPPALKNILDHFQSEYHFKPSAIVTYSAGSFGGVRAAVHLRAITGELGMPSIPSMFPVSSVQNAFDDEGNAIDEAYNRRIVRFLDELDWYAEAMKKQRAAGTPY